MSFVSNIKNWLLNDRDISNLEKFNVMFITKDVQSIESLREFLDELENIEYFIISNYISDQDTIRLNNSYSNIVKKNKINFVLPVVLIIDFADSLYIMGERFITYEEKIENRREFREKCVKVALYNYEGLPIRLGYWQKENFIENEKLHLMKVSKWGYICQQIKAHSIDLSRRPKTLDNKKIWERDLKIFLIKFFTLLFEDYITDYEDDDEDYEEDYDEEEETIISNISFYIIENIPEWTNYNISKRLKLILHDIVKDSSFEKWVVGFSHETYNVNINYEKYEFYGDSLFFSEFSKFLLKAFPRITPNEASNYQLLFLSAEYQQVWSDDLKLFDRMLKSDLVLNNSKNKTDILESFLGVGATILGDISTELQNSFLEIFIRTLSESLTFDKLMIFGKSKQFVIQVIEHLNFNKSSITCIKDEDSNSKVITTMRFRISSDLLSKFKEEDKRTYENIQDDKERKKIIKEFGLQSIENIKEEYSQTQKTDDEIENILFKKAARIYINNNFTIQNNKRVDEIFKTIKKYDQEVFNLLLEKLSTVGIESEEDLIRLDFKAQKGQYVVFYVNVYNKTDSGYFNGKNFHSFKLNRRAEHDYLKPFEVEIENRNLSVVAFPDRGSKIGNSKKDLTPYEYAKYNAVLEYVNN